MVELKTVEIPGLAAAVRRQNRVRNTAFLDGLEILCGFEVEAFSLRKLILLEQAENGFVATPFRYDSIDELLANALQVIYFCRPGFKAPVTPRRGIIRFFFESVRQQRFMRQALRRLKPIEIIKEVRAWIDDAMMDCPTGSGSNQVKALPVAAYPVYIVDRFAEAGFPFGYEEIMTMPARRLWQFCRVASHRLYDIPLDNPSDLLTVEHLAKLQNVIHRN